MQVCLKVAKMSQMYRFFCPFALCAILKTSQKSFIMTSDPDVRVHHTHVHSKSCMMISCLSPEVRLFCRCSSANRSSSEAARAASDGLRQPPYILRVGVQMTWLRVVMQACKQRPERVHILKKRPIGSFIGPFSSKLRTLIFDHEPHSKRGLKSILVVVNFMVQ